VEAPLRYPLSPTLPSTVQVEVTAACNLRCVMCLVRYRPPVNKIDGAMPIELYRRVIDGLPQLRQVTLQGLGEPLLSPYLHDMIGLAKARGARVGFNSNGTLLTRATADRLVATGLDWLHVSVDAADAATFAKIRSGADFDKVLRNLAGLSAAKRAAGTGTPWIRVVFVAMRDNIAQLPELITLLGDVGVQELRVQNLSHTFADTDPAGAYAEIRSFAAAQALYYYADAAQHWFDAAQAAADRAGLQLRLPQLSPQPSRPAARKALPGALTLDTQTPGCSWPWDATYITSRGIVQPCCMVMGDDRVVLGDLRQDTLEHIWADRPYRDFRRRLLTGPPPAVCTGCALYQGTF
jgi:MoaA/NifB/PqqE/SkfB family radical SAM enzyme